MDSFVDEEGHVIDQLFLRCDISKIGLVDVKCVVDILKKECDKSKSNEPDFVELANILKSYSEDGFLNIMSFRKALKQWISAIRKRSESTSFLGSVSEPDLVNMTNNSTDLSVCLETSASHDDSIFRHSQDVAELLNDLKFQNRKLFDENEKLQIQLEAQEETVSSLSRELQDKVKDEEQLKKRIECLQDQVNMGQMVMEENEVLKSKLEGLQEIKKDLDIKVNSLVKENALLDKQAWTFENKWQKSMSEVDILKKDMQDLQCSYLEERVMLNQAQQAKPTREEKIEEEKLQERIKSLSQQNQKLQEEKEEAEIKLAQIQIKLQRFQDVSLKEDQPKKIPKLICSTPGSPLSICMELKDRLNEDKHLPSPLCEKQDLYDEVLTGKTALLPQYLSTWDLEFSAESSITDTSFDLFTKNSPVKPVELDLGKKLASLKKLGKNSLENEIIRLCRVNLDLAERCHKAELRETELKDEIEKNTHTAEQEKQKSVLLEVVKTKGLFGKGLSLYQSILGFHDPEEKPPENIVEKEKMQESLNHSLLARNLDLKDLWRLVHCPEEEEEESSESDSSLSPSTEILKQQIKQDIEALREKLQKRESILKSLRKSVPRLPYRNKRKSSSSSLVDALNIDVEKVQESGSFEYQSGLSIQTDCKDCNKNQFEYSQSFQSKHNNNRSVPLLRRHNKVHFSVPHWNTMNHVNDNVNIMESGIMQNNNVVALKNKLNATCDTSSYPGDGFELQKSKNFGSCDNKVTKRCNAKLTFTENNEPRDILDYKNEHGKSPVLRRRSYVNAIENEDCLLEDGTAPRGRTDSFQTAIEYGQSSSQRSTASMPTSSSVGDTTPENETTDSITWNNAPKFSSTPLPVSSKPVVKNVNFHPKIFIKEESIEHEKEISEISKSRVNSTDTDESENPTNFGAKESPIYQSLGNQKKNTDRNSIRDSSVLTEEEIPCVCCDTNEDLNDVKSSQSDKTSSQFDDFSPEVWTLSRTSENSDLSSSRDSGHSSSMTNSCGNVPTDEVVVTDLCDQIIKGDGDNGMEEVSRSLLLSDAVIGPKQRSEKGTCTNDIVEETHSASVENTEIINPIKERIQKSELQLNIIKPVEQVIVVETDIVKPTVQIQTENSSDANINNAAASSTDGTHLLSTDLRKVDSSKKFSFLRIPDHPNMLTPLLAISPILSPPPSPSINFFQSRDKMKGPKTGQLSDLTKAEENNNKDDKVAKVETDKTETEKTDNNDVPKTSSYLAKIRETHLAKRRDQLRQNKMPELSELTEKDGMDDTGKAGTIANDVRKPEIIQAPEPNGDILPSIPDEFLVKLGLSADDVNSDELSDQEIESKFSSLSLAFKTDAQTLEKRLEIQERSRDIAEQNVDKELQGLRSALSKLNQICTDPQVREVLSKIQNHIDILEKSSARVSSRAEVFGAIQQEKRLSKAVDIMVHHVENIHRVHEKEHAELEEARKLLQDSRSLGSSALDIPGGDLLSRRSASVCPNNMGMGKIREQFTIMPCSGKGDLMHLCDAIYQSYGLGTPSSGSLTPATVKAIKLMKPRRRVSEIALPKVLGGSGAANLHPSPSMDHAFDTRPMRAFALPQKSDFPVDDSEGITIPHTVQNDTTDSISRISEKDPKSRFQAVVASTTVKSAITNSLRRTSLEKQSNVFSLPPSSESPQISRTGSAESTKDSQEKEKQQNLEEEAFKKGYEQGMRASLGQDLTSLREQQNRINESLGDIMDNIDSNLEEPKDLREILHERFQGNFPKIQISSWRIRLTMSCFFVVMAILSVLMSLFPVNSAELYSYRNLGYPPL